MTCRMEYEVWTEEGHIHPFLRRSFSSPELAMAALEEEHRKDPRIVGCYGTLRLVSAIAHPDFFAYVAKDTAAHGEG